MKNLSIARNNTIARIKFQVKICYFKFSIERLFAGRFYLLRPGAEYPTFKKFEMTAILIQFKLTS